MPKTLNQHQIRRRAVQALFSYKVQNDMATTVVSEFRKNVESLEAALSQPIRFEVEYRDERITVRKFPKQLSKPLEAIAGIYDILGVENVEKTAVTKAMTFMRDFGGFTKKMNEYDANDLFKGVMANLNLVKLFQIDLDEELPTAPKVLEFLRALPQDSTSEQAFATFQKIFSMLHENILEKYTLDLFTPIQLQNELDEKLSQVELKTQAQTDELLRKTKVFVLNYDNDAPEAIEVPEYFTTLVDGILANSTTLEAELSKYLAKNWSFARLTLVEQSLLLVAAYEIMFTDTPDVVAVNEAIELSKDFSDEKSSRFVNGVLTNLVK